MSYIVYVNGRPIENTLDKSKALEVYYDSLNNSEEE